MQHLYPPSDQHLDPGTRFSGNWFSGKAFACLLFGCSFLFASQCPDTVFADEDAKGQSLFDGKTLDGWDGDPRFWSVRDGVITGQTTADNPTEHNTFLIWRDGVLGDFQLDLDFRMEGGNSGIQYRSREDEKWDKWVIGGYQADFDAPGNYVGILYEERGRGILALLGQKVAIGDNGKPQQVGATTDPDKIKGSVKSDQWNHYTIIAKGNHLIHKVNGMTTVDVTDNDTDKRVMKGLLALQVHAGPPMLVQFRNIRLQKLGDDASSSQSDKAKSIKLFDGKSLSGWSFHCDEPNVKTEDVWSVEAGVLKCKGRPVGYLRTDKSDYKNYKLSLQWRWPGSGGNNGVLVHVSKPHALGVWPKSIEVQLGSGDAGDFWIIGTDLDVENESARKKGRRHINLTDGSEKPLQQWNTMEVECVGDKVTVLVNDQLVNVAENCSVTEGAIALQSEGTPIEFRNIELTPLP
jgi:hypothetical protein